MMGMRYAGRRRTTRRRLGVEVVFRPAILAVVMALAVVSCSAADASPEASAAAARTQAAQPTKAATVDGQWPSCGQVRKTLQGKGYAFTHTSSHTWRVIKSSAFAIVIDDRDDAAPGVSMSVYNAGYEKFRSDIDTVFRVIDPDALSWAHDALNQTKMETSFATMLTAPGGTVTVNWSKSEAVLSFVFTGK
jgi:hypothetical protein